MKITIEEEDKDEAKKVLSYLNSLILISDIDNRLREVIKYQHPITRDDLIEELRDTINDSHLLELLY